MKYFSYFTMVFFSLTLFSCRVSDTESEHVEVSSSSSLPISSVIESSSSAFSFANSEIFAECIENNDIPKVWVTDSDTTYFGACFSSAAKQFINMIGDSITAQARCETIWDCRVAASSHCEFDIGYSILQDERITMQYLADSLAKWQVHYLPVMCDRMGNYLTPTGCVQGFCQFEVESFSGDSHPKKFLDSLEATATCHTQADCQTVQGSCSALGYSLLVHDSSAAQKTIDSLDRVNVRNEIVYGCKVDSSVYTASGCVDGFCRFQWTVQP